MNEIDVPRVNILGVGVHALNMRSAVDILDDAATNGTKGYVTVTGVHGIMEAQDDASFKDVLNSSLLTTPDGMPTVWIGRSRGFDSMGRVYGPELMLEVCRRSIETGHTHFIYGGAPGVADELAGVLKKKYPGLRVVGTSSPPFRPLDEGEERELIERMSELRPDFFWVCLGAPKQERFMAEYSPKLSTTVMIGVGAACDILTGRTKDAPGWVKQSGLQWLHRLLQEPKRLWRRYLILNPRFIYSLMRTPSNQRAGGQP
jgi:N-acetylglucosaminyldiphosphoundecaprenol N-acetyl-beta-D-mannosaminyltransferase